MPVFLIEFHPLQTLFSLGILLGARHGDARGIDAAAVYFGLLFWRPLLDAVQQVREAAYQAGVIATWA